jgi:hypothetical protein
MPIVPDGRRYAAFLAIGHWLLALSNSLITHHSFSMPHAPSPMPSSSTPISSKRGSDNIDNIDNIDNFSAGEQGSRRKENFILFIFFIFFIVSLKIQRDQGLRFQVQGSGFQVIGSLSHQQISTSAHSPFVFIDLKFG